MALLYDPMMNNLFANATALFADEGEGEEESTTTAQESAATAMTNMADAAVVATSTNSIDGGVVLMHCDNRRKFHLWGSARYKYARATSNSPAKRVYLILHQTCHHVDPIIQINHQHPDVPHIYKSIYHPQFNGVYRNGLGEIVTDTRNNNFTNVSRIRDVIRFSKHNSRQQPGSEIEDFAKMANLFVTLRLGVTPQSKDV